MKLTTFAAVPLLAFCSVSMANEDVSFTLTNNTGYTMTEIFLSPSSEESWGDNILEESIRDGETLFIRVADGLPECEYDIHYEFLNSEPYVEYEVDMCEINGTEFVMD